ncbi:MAG TPA: Lrp/AsnC ligand binding domain-containing protein [Blastocatellia bacterium]|nr:Lrp/AsnC ligand binding domain-containing protein [Blastocatellia bacterium]
MKKSLLAFVFVQTDPRGFNAAALLARIPEVEELHRVAGEDCYVARVRAENTEELGRLVKDKIERIGAVCSTRTTLVLKTFKERGVGQLERRRARAATTGSST